MNHDTPLTQKQRDLLIYVCAYLMETGTQPSIREIGERFGIKSPNGVLCHIRSLKRKGYLDFRDGAARSLRLLRWPDGSPFRGLRAAETDPLPREGMGESPETSEVNP